MQHVEAASPGKERQPDSRHVCQLCFKFCQYFPQQRGKSEVTGIIYPDGSDSFGVTPHKETDLLNQ